MKTWVINKKVKVLSVTACVNNNNNNNVSWMLCIILLFNYKCGLLI